ncbi:MAG: hypothetical protein JO339_40120 [Alphaproteobacteria bacterium]|nr:hypothetical protein [Alphaproteobacteria bacterium]
MRFSNARFAFEIPDEWWNAANMAGFVAERTAYRAGPPGGPDHVTIVVPVDGLAVPPRGPGVPDFGRDRMVRVLEAIRRDESLEPIQITKASEGRGHVLYDGRHRLAASIAVGYAQMPAVVLRTTCLGPCILHCRPLGSDTCSPSRGATLPMSRTTSPFVIGPTPSGKPSGSCRAAGAPTRSSAVSWIACWRRVEPDAGTESPARSPGETEWSENGRTFHVRVVTAAGQQSHELPWSDLQDALRAYRDR